MNVSSVCYLLGHSHYLNVEVLLSLEKLTVLTMAYVYFIIKALNKLSLINPHNSPVGQVLLYHKGGDWET